MDRIKERTKIDGLDTYKYGLFDTDFLGRESLESLLEKGQITLLDYEAATCSINSLLLKNCYQAAFKNFHEEFTMPGNYTPPGWIRHGQKLINIKKQRDEVIKFAKQKVQCPYRIIRDADGRVQRVKAVI